MNDEPTKACVRVLRIESMMRYYIKKGIEKIGNTFEFLIDYVNWCIVRAFMRWVGPPVAVYTFYLGVINTNYHNGISGSLFLLFMISTLSGIFAVFSWMYIPYSEKQILNSYQRLKHE
jgi:hypothetical protein